jgi:hypothetical protein
LSRKRLDIFSHISSSIASQNISGSSSHGALPQHLAGIESSISFFWCLESFPPLAAKNNLPRNYHRANTFSTGSKSTDMAAQQIPQAKKPDPPPAPPPPPPPPPAIPPVLNPYGVHFQPPVPATDMGPMVHHYVPRYDNGIPNAGPEMCYPVQQAPVAMVSFDRRR